MANDADALGQARERLAVLDRERASLLAAIRVLESSTGGPDITTAEGRVRLFASLFRGREDVFATRWESRTQSGRSGWAPRCSNEWRPGVCHKPKVKCAACAHRRFVRLSEQELRGHLEGRQTIGIYPLLQDETCHLVAIDLDGPSWREDARPLHRRGVRRSEARHARAGDADRLEGHDDQYAGRLHRHHDDKREVRIIDYVDHEVPVLRCMYAKRQRAYASLGYRPG